jgi:hypothetical protein
VICGGGAFASLVELGINAASFETVEALAATVETDVTALFTFPGEQGHPEAADTPSPDGNTGEPLPTTGETIPGAGAVQECVQWWRADGIASRNQPDVDTSIVQQNQRRHRTSTLRHSPTMPFPGE